MTEEKTGLGTQEKERSLEELNIYELRRYAGEVGVHNWILLKKKELIAEIEKIERKTGKRKSDK